MIPFNKPYLTGNEADYIQRSLLAGHVAGDGNFSKDCHRWLEKNTGVTKALLTHSCTGALDIAALLSGVKQGDEVILPSFTFVSTANAFVLCGATPVFVDIRPDTQNIDETLIEDAITERTKAIVPVHYAGVGCEMDAIMDIAKRHDLLVIEDAAQGLMSTYKGRPLGAIGDMGAFSFHETKNIIAGEGGALLLRDKTFVERAEIIREKGTNRQQFFRGQVDKYTWSDVGSSYLPSDMNAAFLMAQLDQAEKITEARLNIWNRYYDALKVLEDKGLARLPKIPQECTHNGHMFYLLLPDLESRTDFIAFLKENDIHAYFHYVPLHSSPKGLKSSRAHGDLKNTIETAERLVRLPLFGDLSEEDQNFVVSKILSYFGV
ncbi:MAG: dTDP-4-amino-4,6-dideoxygalactose transaminase [Sneathiella sp.]|uniref:dTDP-4-amino-4,6-dideoxygalactose transaminase n=1 Tax=Sneathiella sp. TaxID=1964365 RepID=UPI000C61BE77|nr:dTDP-4-amino-4,6-dideoxygalactose transaminase [Sneathiella sp.]MAZ04155.1 dTDP-4-amino-4,6-dideoxygalactose transaminase [Sneathiella sp.]